MTRIHYSRSWAVENYVICEYYDIFLRFCIFPEYPYVKEIGTTSESKGPAVYRISLSESEWTGVNFHK